MRTILQGTLIMIQENEVRQRLISLLNEDQSLDDFEDWLVAHSWNMHLDSTRETQHLVASIELSLAEYSNLHISEAAMREQLMLLLAQIPVRLMLGIGVAFADPSRPSRSMANSYLTHSSPQVPRRARA